MPRKRAFSSIFSQIRSRSSQMRTKTSSESAASAWNSVSLISQADAVRFRFRDPSSRWSVTVSSCPSVHPRIRSFPPQHRVLRSTAESALWLQRMKVRQQKKAFTQAVTRSPEQRPSSWLWAQVVPAHAVSTIILRARKRTLNFPKYMNYVRAVAYGSPSFTLTLCPALNKQKAFSLRLLRRYTCS